MKTVALTVLTDRPDAPLSPFFARARWISLIDWESRLRTLIRNPDFSAQFIIEQICRARPDLVICGHIDHRSAQRIASAGIDLRLGPCSEPAQSLLDRASSLPTAMTLLPPAQPLGH